MGDDCVPAGQLSWQCAAAALPAPWPSAEQQLVQLQEEQWLDEQEWWQEEDDDGEAAATEEGSGSRGRSGGGPPQVVAIHEGSGQQASPGFRDPHFVAGRLLVYADGSLRFAWGLPVVGDDGGVGGEADPIVTEMRRLRLPD